MTGACGREADNGIWDEQADAYGMGQISFTANLQRHLPCPSTRAEGSTVREVLDGVFVDNPRLRSYLLDDQGQLRRHVNIFVNDRAIADRDGMRHPVASADQIFVYQALSGGCACATLCT